MPYIGKQPLTGAYQLCDTITTSATATYNLLVGGSAVIPGSAQNCIVSLNGVIQAPVNAFTVSGSTITFASTLSATDVIDFILILGNVFDIGTPTNGTVTPSSIQGGTSGLFTWQSVQTTGFTAVAGRAYPCNTTSAGFTVTLPATPSIGNQVLLLDYAGTADTNVIIINPNGNKLEGGTANLALSGEREGVTLTYIDSTQGWLASSGINEGTDALSPAPYSIDFLVIAGGAGGGSGGGGAGGYRTSTQTVSIGTAITVTVGDGGAQITNGSNSSISGSGLSTITSTGGGKGGINDTQDTGNGGSGGGGGATSSINVTGGSGNTPSTSPSQGNNGGNSINTGPYYPGGGGGGASAVGGNGTGTTGGNGGAGTASSITGSSVTRAGGGGGGAQVGGTAGSGGSGGGGAGSISVTATAGTANTGGGGGAGSYQSSGAAGGKGVVILSMATSNYTGTTTGSPTVTTSGSNTILQFNGTGSYTA